MKQKSIDSYLLRVERNKLSKTLIIIQRLLGELDFMLYGQVVSPRELANMLFRPFLAMTYSRFAIGDYRVSLKMRIIPSRNRYASIIVIIKSNEGLILSTSCASFPDNLSGASEDAKYWLAAFRGAINVLGELHPASVDRQSFLGMIIKNRSEELGKISPINISFDVSVRELANKGDVEGVKKLLHEFYALSRPLIAPELMFLLHDDGRQEIKRAKNQRKVLDTSIDFLEKIEKKIVGGSHFFIVPTLDDKPPVERKVFLYFYDSIYIFNPDIFLKVLTEAGWGGSILVATGNYPTLHEFLDTKQIDFIIQSLLDIDGSKDLYDDELIKRDDADHWKNKVTYCDLSHPLEVEVQKYLPEKLLKTKE